MDNKDFISDTLVLERDLYESVSGKSKSEAGILRTIKGPVAEYVKPNRNKRVYSESLWDKVLESPYVKEQLKYKTLYGELNHPESRYEVDFTRVSHSITEMWKVPASDQIYATINILDTPSGQILNTLYEAGGVIGYSSRAGGTLHQKKDYIEVDENTYNFITFDAVPFPSVQSARPDEIVSEGVDYKPEVASLTDEVHDKLCKIISESGLSNRDSLKSLIYSIEYFDMSKEKALLESMDLNNVVENNSSSETTMSLLKESSLQIDELKASNQVLESNNLALKAENEVLKRSLDDSVEKLANAISESKKVEETKAFDRRKVNDTISNLESTNAELESKLEDAMLVAEEVEDLRQVIQILKDENKGLKAEVLESTKNSTCEEELTEAYDELSRMVSELDSSKSEINSLNESIKELSTSLEDMKTQLEASESMVLRLQSDKKSLLKESKNFDEALSDSSLEIKRLSSENAELLSQIKTLKSNASSGKENVSESTKYRDDLISVICSGYNLEPSEVRKYLNEGFTKSDVYCVCEEMSNSKKNGISYNSLVTESLDSNNNNTKSSEEHSQLNYIYSNSAVNRRGIGIV